MTAFDSLVYRHFAGMCSAVCVQFQAVSMLLYRTDLTFAPLANQRCHLHSRQAEIVTVWSTLWLYQGFSSVCMCVCRAADTGGQVDFCVCRKDNLRRHVNWIRGQKLVPIMFLSHLLLCIQTLTQNCLLCQLSLLARLSPS